MTVRMLATVVVAALAAAVIAGTAGAITPANGGDAGGSLVAINNGVVPG